MNKLLKVTLITAIMATSGMCSMNPYASYMYQRPNMPTLQQDSCDTMMTIALGAAAGYAVYKMLQTKEDRDCDKHVDMDRLHKNIPGLKDNIYEEKAFKQSEKMSGFQLSDNLPELIKKPIPQFNLFHVLNKVIQPYIELHEDSQQRLAMYSMVNDRLLELYRNINKLEKEVYSKITAELHETFPIK